MKINIKFYPGFEKYLKDKSNQILSVKFQQAEDVKTMISHFLPEDMAGFVGIVLVNKKITNMDFQVRDGDLIEVFPLIGGG